MRKYLCWLLGHSFICLFRYTWPNSPRHMGSQYTAWICQYCGKQRFEQWDT